MNAPLVQRGAYDYADAALYLACSERQLRNYVDHGLIVPRFHGTKGSKPVFLRDDLDDLLLSLPDEKPATGRRAA